MSLFRKKHTEVDPKFESWLPAVTVTDPDAPAVPASAKAGRTRNSQEHLEAAIAALAAKEHAG